LFSNSESRRKAAFSLVLAAAVSPPAFLARSDKRVAIANRASRARAEARAERRDLSIQRYKSSSGCSSFVS
jgi:predicted amidohydrolase YtcJ